MRRLADGLQQPAETSVPISVASLAIGCLKQRLKVVKHKQAGPIP